MTDKTQPEALRLAEQYDYGDPVAHSNMWKAAVCNELLRQHIRITELETQLEAVGAGGVQALSAGPGASRAAPPSTYVNGAGIRAEDGASAVIRKLDARFHDIVTFKAVDAAAASPTPQALSAAPAGWKLVPVEPTKEMVAAACREHGYPGGSRAAYVHGYKSMIAASPTPPAEQQATTTEAALEGVYAELVGKEVPSYSDDALFMVRASEMSDFADRTHALRMEQAAPKAAPASVTGQMQFGGCPECGSRSCMARQCSRTVSHSAQDAPGVQWQCGQQASGFAAPQQEALETTTIDQKTMELAESVGLIGPASRIGDLHAAIQRFHDLICVNATIKAAVMAADVISGVATPARDYPPLPMQFACSGVFPVYSADQMRAYVDADRAAYAPASSRPAPAPLSDDAKDAARWRWLSEHIGAAWNEGKFTSLVRIVSDKNRAALNASIDRMMTGDWSDAALAAQGGKV